jgi:hypothetical protein
LHIKVLWAFSCGRDPKLILGTAHAITSAHADRQSKGRDRKDLPLETRIQFSHLHANALEFRACGARREVRVACRCVGEGALPSDIGLAAITASMFDEYFTGWKPDRDAHGGSLASYIEDLGGQTRLGIIMGAFDYPDGASRADRALSEHGNGRCDREGSSSRCQMQKSSTGKVHGVISWNSAPCGGMRDKARGTRKQSSRYRPS